MFDYNSQYFLGYGLQPCKYNRSRVIYNATVNILDEIDFSNLLPNTQ